MTYDTARAIFRTAIRLDAGAFILEIARSEIAYTDQRPAEYVAVMLAAALREGFRGPVFIQGDHFQVNAQEVRRRPEDRGRRGEGAGARGDRRRLLQHRHRHVDARRPVASRRSTSSSASTTRCASTSSSTSAPLEPKGVTISVGGEIGEVGTAELARSRSCARSWTASTRTLPAQAPRPAGLSQDQRADRHVARRRRARRRLDRRRQARPRRRWRRCRKVAREEYGLAGAVQHGASTLPDERVPQLPASTETAEIHLATNFQNMLYDTLPPARCATRCTPGCARTRRTSGRPPTPTSSSSTRRARRRSARSSALWDLDRGERRTLAKTYDEKFTFLFTQLAVGATKDAVRRHVKPMAIHRPAPGSAGHVVVEAAPDDADLSD